MFSFSIPLFEEKFASTTILIRILNILIGAEIRDINERFLDGMTLLHVCCKGGHLEAVRTLINKDAKVEAKTQRGLTPLHLAARSGHLEVVKLLMDEGSDVNIKDNFNRTPLLWAAQQGRLEVVRHLVRNGAGVGIKDKYGCTPLHRQVLSSKWLYFVTVIILR